MSIRTTLLALTAALTVTAAHAQSFNTRVHDQRTFKPVESKLESLPGASLYKGTHAGEHGQASYLIEVPDNWNGTLVMYAHGYRGTGENLTVDAPPIRQYLTSQGYAWAASSYSSNYYDVRAGVEDTNALALAFEKLTGGKHGKPAKHYIMGFSMGGHVTAAAVEAETLRTARNRVRYAAALPLCGVMADEHEFQYLNDYTLAAQQLSGLGPASFPAKDYAKVLPAILNSLFAKWSLDPANREPWQTTAQGEQLRAVVRNLSGGERPVFNLGFDSFWQKYVFGAGGSDGTVNGILNSNLLDNTTTVYQFDNDPAVSPAERAFNDAIIRVKASPAANFRRPDGLRWIPAVNGEFNVPVVSLHTLGDLYVPFGHQQRYLVNATAKGNADRLVQRAIRAAGHCEFTGPELVEAFNDLAAWEQKGIKPQGDSLAPATVADPNYGCRFTRGVRTGVPTCPNN